MTIQIEAGTLRQVIAWMQEQADAMEPVIVPPVEEEPPTSPNTRLFASGNTLQEAKTRFRNMYSREPADCDPNELGWWTCSSHAIEKGTVVVVDPPADDDPVEPDPTIPVTPGKASVVKLPVRAENRFKYTVNSSSDSDVYTDAAGIQRQVFVFYNEDRETCVASRRFPNGQFVMPINIHKHIDNGRELEYDNHNAAVVGVAPDGTIFVCANHHVDPLSMAVTARPYDLTSFRGFDRRDMPEQIKDIPDTDRVTYPSFFNHRGYLCLSYREQEVGGGNARYRWVLKKYDHVAGRWENMVSINDGNNLRLYVSNIATSSDGNRIHFAAIWRDDSVSDKGTHHQHDYFHMFSDNGIDWYQYTQRGDSVRVNLPVKWTAPGKSEVPENIWVTPTDPIPNGAGSIAVDHYGYPHMLMDIKGGQLVYHYYVANNGWHESRGPLDTADDQPFPVRDKMCAVSHKGDSIYFHVMDGSNKPSTRLLAKGYVNSDFNISVDRSAIQRGYLSVMMTKCKSAAPRTTKERYPTDVYFLDVPLDDLATFDNPFTL